MTLKLIYRSYGGENMKNRPDYYSKLVCLESFLRAAENVDAQLVFINDGPIPDERARLMRAAGEIVDLPQVGMRRSYIFALRFATAGRWGRDDFVWFSEDDFLYQPEAFCRLQEATEGIHKADYFAFHGSTTAFPLSSDKDRPRSQPLGWTDHQPWELDGHRWVNIQSTTSTFGCRVGSLREDFGIFLWCMFPHVKSYRDHDTSLLYQGFEPYSYVKLARDLFCLSPGNRRQRIRGMMLAPFLFATNLRSHRLKKRRRLLVVAEPNLATHLETGLLALGTDWAGVAGSTSDWGVARLTLSEPDTA